MLTAFSKSGDARMATAESRDKLPCVYWTQQTGRLPYRGKDSLSHRTKDVSSGRLGGFAGVRPWGASPGSALGGFAGWGASPGSGLVSVFRPSGGFAGVRRGLRRGQALCSVFRPSVGLRTGGGFAGVRRCVRCSGRAMLRFLALSFARQPIGGGGDPLGEQGWRHYRCRSAQRLDQAG